MITDKERITKALTDGTADFIIRDGGSYYLLKGTQRTFIQSSTFVNSRSVLEEVGKNKWKLKEA